MASDPFTPKVKFTKASVIGLSSALIVLFIPISLSAQVTQSCSGNLISNGSLENGTFNSFTTSNPNINGTLTTYGGSQAVFLSADPGGSTLPNTPITGFMANTGYWVDASTNAGSGSVDANRLFNFPANTGANKCLFPNSGPGYLYTPGNCYRICFYAAQFDPASPNNANLTSVFNYEYEDSFGTGSPGTTANFSVQPSATNDQGSFKTVSWILPASTQVKTITGVAYTGAPGQVVDWRTLNWQLICFDFTPSVTTDRLHTYFSTTSVNNGIAIDGICATACGSVSPSCALTTTATPGICNSTTNKYTVTGTISLTNASAGTATITDGTSTTTVAVAAGATSVAYSLAGLTSGTGSHTVTVTLPDCGTATTTYSAPASCTGTTPSCSDFAVVVGNWSDASLQRFDGSTDNYEKQLATGIGQRINSIMQYPKPNGNLYLGGYEEVNVVDAFTGALKFSFSGGPFSGLTEQIVVGADGNIYVANEGTGAGLGSIARYNAITGTYIDTFIGFPSYQPNGLAQDAAGNWYVSTRNSPNEVHKYSSTGTFLGIVTTMGTSGTGGGLKVFNNELYVVTTDGTQSVKVFTLPVTSFPATPVRTIATGGSTFVGIDFGPDNNLYLADFYNSRVSVWNPTTGAAITTLTDGSISTPHGVGFTTCLPVPCSFVVTATPGTCNPATNQYALSGTISLTGTTGGTATITDGTSTTTVAVAAGATSVAYSLAGLTSGTGSHTVTVTLPDCGTATTTYSAPASCTVAPCGLAMLVTPGLCEAATNAYVLSGTITATNVPTNGTLTIASGAFTTRTLSLSAGNTSGTFSYSGLVSNGQPYTVTASYSNSACSPVSQTYTAPASCSVAPVCSLTATATAGLCATATNTYSATAIVRLTNPTAGTLTITNGASSATFVTTAATSNTFTAIFNGLISDGSQHDVTVSLPGCSTTSTTYTAPASCSVAPVCSISAVATPGLCQTATNTFTNVVVVTLTNPTAGILTVTDGPASLTFATTAVSSATFTATFAGISSDGTSHTVTVGLPGCSTIETVYSAPISCSVAPVCSLTATATAGLCATATNTYSATAIVVLTNPAAGILTIANGPKSITFTTTAVSSITFTGVFTDLVSDGIQHTVTATLPGCSTTSTTYTAPASCSIAPICSVSATATAGLCATATNTYSATAVITVNNPAAGVTLSVSTGGQTLTFSTTALSSNTFRATFNGLISDGNQHDVTVSLPGCGTTTATYTAPVACSVAPVCSLSALVNTGLCAPATNTFSNTVVVTMSNPTAGTLTVTDGTRSVTFVVPASVGTTTAVAVFNGILSDGSLHTVTVSLPGCSTTSTTYTAPVACTVCSLSLTTASLPNGQVGTAYSQTLTASGGTTPYTYAVLGSLPAGLSLNTGVISGTPTEATTASFTITVSDAKSCTDVAALSITTSNQPVCSLTATATPGTCNSATNTYAVTGSVSATNTTASQSLTISLSSSSTVVTLTGNGPLSYTLTGLASDGLTHTLTVVSSATSCGTTSVTYSAPASCTVAPPALNVLVSTPLCNSLTNQYTATATVSLSNVLSGTLTITDNGTTIGILSLTAGQTTASFSTTGTSNASSHTVIATLTGGISASTTYTAPVACTVCSLSLTTASLPNGQVGTAYSQTLTTTGGSAPLSYTVSAGSLPAGLSLNASTGVLSGTPTAAGSFTATLSVNDSKGCTATLPLTVLQIELAPVCSLSLTVTPGSCTTATNAYTLTGLVNLTNTTTGGQLVVSDGLHSITLTVSNTDTSMPFSLTGVSSDGLVHTLTATLSGCGTTSTTYAAPQSCRISPCQPPIHVCKGTDYAILLQAPAGQTTYQWYRNGTPISGATLNSYTATLAGSYSVVVNGNVAGQCPNGNCCPILIQEDSIATYQAQAQAPTCNSATSPSANADGRILVTNWMLSASDTTTYFYQVSLGSSFNEAQLVAGSTTSLVPASGLLVGNLANPGSAAGQTYTVRLSNGLGCTKDVVVILPQTQCDCPPSRCLPIAVKRTR